MVVALAVFVLVESAGLVVLDGLKAVVVVVLAGFVVVAVVAVGLVPVVVVAGLAVVVLAGFVVEAVDLVVPAAGLDDPKCTG